jgi:dihydroorotate dehydrogenase (NAD+) catalytic subunit
MDLAPNNPYGLALRSPAVAAAGCFGYGVEYARAVDLAQVGAVVTRTTTLQPARPARPPRLIETPGGVLCVGRWPNPGLRAVVERHAPVWATWETPVILSVAAETPGECGQLAGAVEGVEGIAALELSLPDAPARALGLLRAARAATHLPLLAKLPALDPEPLAELARALAGAGADALTVSPWPPALQIDPESGERLEGRLSGPALLPLALRLVAAVAAAAPVPVLGGGGAASPADARRFLAAGASAVQIGAALLVDPGLLMLMKSLS